MEINYDIWLILLSLIASCLVFFVTFNLVEHLYHTVVADKLPLLAAYSIAVGSGLWGVHCINLLAFHSGTDFNFITLSMLDSWLAAQLIGFIACYVGSNKILHFKTLVIGSIVAGISAYCMFYLGITGLNSSASILKINAYIPVEPMSLMLALVVSVGVSAISITGLSWVKDYSGENKVLIKIILSLVTAVAILSTHVTFNASIALDTHNFSIVAGALGDKKLLALIMALGLICLFLLVFIIALYYEKQGINTFRFSILNAKKNIDLADSSFKDALTQLPNRRGFQHNLESATKRCTRAGGTVALAYIDLDHFKPINDNFGHHVGDAVLVAVAQRLNAAVRGCDSVARLGGDEFVALIEEIDSNDDITPIVERIVKSIKEPFIIDQQQIEISCSIGVAIFPQDGDMDKLMICADAAMYKAKENGKNQFKFFDVEIELASDQMLEMQRDLRMGIENNEFSLVFQPKVDCKNQSPIGAEALIRWNHPTKGVILPNTFIPAAERFGLINQINDWVVEESCRVIYRAKNNGVNLNLSINLANQQFRNPNLVANVLQLIKQYNVPASSLIFEIKETVAVKNEAQFKLLLDKFKTANIKVALDDFGSHPFSLSYLQNLAVDEIKLDKIFVAQINENKASRALIDAVIRLAHALDLNVVAEGVETEAQRIALVELGCNHMQGYLFSRPISEKKLFKLFEKLSMNFESTGEFSVSDYQSEAA